MLAIKKVLIANRGEIAVRIIKTCQRLGIKTVVIYSNPDANSPAVFMADEAIAIGGETSSESYLVVDKILDAIKKTGADAVHPGYGFLSENSKFVQTLEKEGIIFIGPNSKAIDAMGDKISSKILAEAAKVNTIPGCKDVIKDAQHAKTVAAQVGFPVMMKASAGGGGKGIRVVKDESEVESLFISVTNEGQKSFGDSRIFIEKFIENPRHIEIQIIADKHGNVVCLGERECSIQRNNQKIIEEAPSSFLTNEVREEMYKQAVMLASKVGYDSAGTLEFVVDKNRNFYFLEMNTRLQVEHPVTEFITGYDLVELMIRSAEGAPLKITQKDVVLKGWAFESRICAENPSKGFLPSSGRLSVYQTPKNARVDDGVIEGSCITSLYDAMIAKVITHGNTREEARIKATEALNEFVIEGIDNNIDFLQAIYNHPKFIDGNFSTQFIREEFPKNFTGTRDITPDIQELFSCVALVLYLEQRHKTNNLPGQLLHGRTSSISDFTVFIDGGLEMELSLLNTNGNVIKILLGKTEEEFSYSYKRGSKTIKIIKNNAQHIVKIKNFYSSCTLSYSGVVKNVFIRNARTAGLYKICLNNLSSSTKFSDFESPLTGLLTSVNVTEGQEVIAGTPLVTIEAMKMENVLRAEFDTKIKKINCKAGDIVSIGDLLIEFDNKTNDKV